MTTYEEIAAMKARMLAAQLKDGTSPEPGPLRGITPEEAEAFWNAIMEQRG